MAVITIAVCDEVRKDAQKLVKKLSELIPEAEILVYRNRESLLNGLKDEHKRCDVLFMGLDGEKGENLETVRAIRLGGNYVPVVLVAANDHFYKEAFEVFAFNLYHQTRRNRRTGACDETDPALLRAGRRKGTSLSVQDADLYFAAQAPGLHIKQSA